MNEEPVHKEWELLGPTLFLMVIGYILIKVGWQVCGSGLIGLCLCQKHEIKVIWIIKVLVAIGLVILLVDKGK